MSKYIVGIDIGGTKIAAGAVTSSGKILKKITLPTNADRGYKYSIGQVYKAIEEVILSAGGRIKEVGGIGVCAPGPLDPSLGIVHNPPNLPGWREVHLTELIKKKFKKRTKLENDANAAGIAEVLWGAAKGLKNVFYVTVSTGIGTAIIIDGKIYHGKNGMAGEGGHVTINFDAAGTKCKCGTRGCIEHMASGPGTVKRVVRKLKKSPESGALIRSLVSGKLKDVSMITLGKAAEKGDKLAISAIKEQGKFIGVWLGGMISLLDPEIIVIGGGVSLLGKILFREIILSSADNTINVFAKKTPIVPAVLKREVGVLGAASLFMD